MRSINNVTRNPLHDSWLYNNDEKGNLRKTLNFKARRTEEATYLVKHIKCDKYFRDQQDEMRVAKSKATWLKGS